jgi:hypothetical protein
MTVHEITEEGESTLRWAFREPGFMGTMRQLACCGRCGETIKKRPNEPMHARDVLKPTVHFLCDACFNALP